MRNYLLQKTSHGKKSKTWYGRYKFDWMEDEVEVKLGAVTKTVASAMFQKIVQEASMEHAGLIAPAAIRKAANQEISELLSEYIDDLTALGRSRSYIVHLQGYINKVCTESNWKTLRDITTTGFEAWRKHHSQMSAKTLNLYLNGLNAFLNFLLDRGKLAQNPLAAVRKVDTRGKKVYMRRALTLDELRRLFAVLDAKERVAVMLGVYCGMRYNEIRNLSWDDLSIDVESPLVKLPASITKNRKESVLPLHPDLVDALRNIRPPNASGKVLLTFKTIRRRLPEAWNKANIPWVDEQGKHADFHALRMTYCTMLENCGTPQRVTQDAMRHSDIQLSASVYTDSSQLHLRQYILALPSITSTCDKTDQNQKENLLRQCQKLFAENPGDDENAGSINKKIELVFDHLQKLLDLLLFLKEMVGVRGFEPPASASRTQRSSQTEPHPVCNGI